MNKTKISWTDYTINPSVGCPLPLCSEGCTHCYARKLHNSRHKAFKTGKKLPIQYAKPFEEMQLFPGRMEAVLRKKKPCKVFVGSMTDIFHKSIPFEFIDKVMAAIALCPQHTFQVLTKRPERMLEYINWESVEPDIIGRHNRGQKIDASGHRGSHICGFTNCRWPIKNLWLGVTVEHPDYKSRIDTLRQIPAAVRFLSIEPCMANMGELNLEDIDWIIVGVESGPKARYCPVENIRSIVEQCKAAGVAVFVKQIHLNGKAKAIKDINLFPEDLKIRQFPAKISEE